MSYRVSKTTKDLKFTRTVTTVANVAITPKRLERLTVLAHAAGMRTAQHFLEVFLEPYGTDSPKEIKAVIDYLSQDGRVARAALAIDCAVLEWFAGNSWSARARSRREVGPDD